MSGTDILNGYRTTIMRQGCLSPQREIELGRRILAAKERDEKDAAACDELVSHHFGLVFKIASKRALPTSDDFHDILQEGMMGLVKAAEIFDYREARFSTCAQWWIRAAIHRAHLLKNAGVHVPDREMSKYYRLQRLEQKLSHSLSRKPTVEELQKAAHMTRAEVESTLECGNFLQAVSFDEPVDDSVVGGPTLGDFFSDTKAVSPLTSLEANETLLRIRGSLEKAFTRVSPRNQAIFKSYWGLDESGKTKTCEEVGKEFGITKQRVGQIVSEAFTRFQENLPSEWQESFTDMRQFHDLKEIVASAQGVA